MLPEAFDAYLRITGAVFDAEVGLFRLTPDQFANLESLFFHIGDVSLLLSIFNFSSSPNILPDDIGVHTQRSDLSARGRSSTLASHVGS